MGCGPSKLVDPPHSPEPSNNQCPDATFPAPVDHSMSLTNSDALLGLRGALGIYSQRAGGRVLPLGERGALSLANDFDLKFLEPGQDVEGWADLSTSSGKAARCYGVRVSSEQVRELAFRYVTLRVMSVETWSAAFSGLTSLQSLELHISPNARVQLPSSLAACALHLRKLSMVNSLRGPFPWALLLQLRRLEELRLGHSDFEPCEINPDLGALAELRVLDLAKCGLFGALPPLNLPQLVYVNLSRNQLSGPLPPEVVCWTALQTLDLEQNAGLCESVPHALLTRPNLQLGTAGTGLTGDAVSFHACSFQMRLLHRDTVLELSAMPVHEEITHKLCTVMRRLPNGNLVVDTQSQTTVVPRATVAFFSQRWLRPQQRDPDDTEHSKWRMIQLMLSERPPCSQHTFSADPTCEVCQAAIRFVWCDKCCIPQSGVSHGGRSAVNSLPAYVQHCGKFVVLHGTAGQREPGGRQRDPSFEEYLAGGWTRQEVMTAQCPSLLGDGTWQSVQTLAADFDSGCVRALELGAELVDPLQGAQIPRNMYSRKDPLRRLDACHQLLLPGIEATLAVLQTSPRAAEMASSLAALAERVKRAKRRIFETSAVEGEPAGTVERGGYVDSMRDGMHVRLSADDATQHEVWYADGRMTSAPRLMEEWETLDVRFFRGGV